MVATFMVKQHPKKGKRNQSGEPLLFFIFFERKLY